MATTPNKGLLLIATGAEVDTWGGKLNDEVFTPIDNMLGGIVSKSLTNVQVDLTADESENLRLVLNGTLTGNVLVTTQCVGFTIVENNCTGAFTVTFQKYTLAVPVGVAVSVPNGTKNLIATGLTGNPSVVGVDFPTGTRLPFQQTTPPAGYTKDITTLNLNNSAMRLVTGTVVNGAGADFSAVFASRTPSGTVAATVLDITQIPLHGHPTWVNDASSSTIDTSGGIALDNNGPDLYPAYTGTLDNTPGHQVGGTGGGQSHDHGLSMSPMDFAVRYFDFSIGVKI